MQSHTLKRTTLFTGFVSMTLLSSCAAQNAGAAAKAPGPLLLAQNKQTTYVIALAAGAPPAERTAARELGDYLKQVSGATFEIKNEDEIPPTQAQILVGAGKRVHELLPTQLWKDLGTDGIVIKTAGKNLILVGGRPRGTLYAVYTFLEDTLGVRWWTPEESTIPKQNTLRITAQDTVYVPPVKIREGFYNTLQRYPRFATQLKNNGHFQTQGEEFGGHYSILGWAHTFATLLPPEKYFKAHPEWYSDVANGNLPCTAASPMPNHDGWQLCLANEEARKELTRNALEWIRKNPEAGVISISQNDYIQSCSCAADLAVQAREGSPSGPLLQFVNGVAADIKQEFPEFLVETLAYQQTRKPPRTIRAADNVVVRLASIEADFARPLNSDANAAFRDDVLGWKAIAPRLYIWDYVTNFHNFVFPHPNIRVLGSNIRFFAQNGAIGLFEQGDAHSGSEAAGDFVALRAWLISHLMWNPALDQKKLENDFLQGYYGAAAPHLRAYLDTIHDAFLKTGGPLSTYQANNSYLTLDVMNTATKHFSTAEAAVAKDAMLARRVRRERLTLDHAWLQRYKALQREAAQRKVKFEGPPNTTTAITEFIELAGEYKVGSFGGLFPTPDKYGALLLEGFKPGVPLPEFALGKAENDIIDAQEKDFRISQQNDWCNLVDDSHAPDGRAARQGGDHTAWAVQYPLNEDDAFLKNGPWHCYALVRVQCKENAKPEGTAFSFGIYDPVNKDGILSSNKPLSDFPDGSYHVADMGKHDLNSRLYFWIAPPGRADIEGVYVDRLVFVREPQ
jgi:hypothetical protein